MDKDDLLKYVQRLVDELEERECLQSPWIKEALFRVPRHLFITQYFDGDDRVCVDRAHPTDEQLKAIYSDRGLMLRQPPDHSAATQPGLVVAMLGDLQVAPGAKVLEIGTGSGWNAGLLAFGVGDDRLVYSMDYQGDLVEAAKMHLADVRFPRVNLRTGDGGLGWQGNAPYDRIIVTVGCPDIPPAWTSQLAEGGLLLVPLKTGGIDPVLRLRKQQGRVEGGFTRFSGFMTLQGAFWTESEDLMRPPWEPLIEELLGLHAVKAALPEPMDVDCRLFLRLKGVRFPALHDDDKGLPWPGGLLDRESGSICVPLWDQPALQVYGDDSTAQRLAVLQQEWIALGRPKVTDYKVEVVEAGSVVEESNAWIDQRPHVTLKFSLAPG